MALIDKPKPSPAPAPTSAASDGTVGAGPIWIFPAYLAGLILVFVGERVLSGIERGAGAITALGEVLVVVTTALRFSPRFRRGGERASIETLLGVLSLVGVLGLLVQFATSDTGAAATGLAKLESASKDRIFGLLRVIWISLIAVSTLPMLFAETALLQMRRAERPESRRVRSAATAGLTLAVAGIYASLLVYAAGGVPWKADYSYFKTSLPSPATRKLAASLNEPIKVVAFFPDVNEARNEVKSYLRQLGAGIPKLQVTVVDRLLAPKLARELRATRDGQIVLARGTETYTLDIDTDITKARPKLRTLDRDFRVQLQKLARTRLTAYITIGHGEFDGSPRPGDQRAASIVRTLLQRQNFEIKDLGLSQGLATDVPTGADLVVVLGPSEQMSSAEIASLQRYVDRGGHLFLALDPDSYSAESTVTPTEPTPLTAPEPKKHGEKAHAKNAPLPAPTSTPEPAKVPSQLGELAKIVGLSISSDILANERNHVRVSFNDSDVTRLVTNTFSSHASVSTLSQHSTRAAVVVFGAGSLDRAPGSTTKVDFSVRAATGTFADKNRNYKRDGESEQSASFNLAAAVTAPIKDAPPPAPEAKPDPKKGAQKKADTKEMRAFVMSDADAFSDLVMSNVVGNQVLFLDAVRWLVGEESLGGQETSEEDVRIEHTKQQDLTWFYATIFGAPCVVLGAGVFFSRRSRRDRGGK